MPQEAILQTRPSVAFLVQIFIVAVPIGLIVLGVRGFSLDGIPLTQTILLKGKAGRLIGTLCILGGICFFPAIFLLMHLLR